MSSLVDRRILKTKQKLKEALVRLLKDKPFEHITVTELCRESGTSRITFYTYYGDKYDLADDYFQDMLLSATGDFERLQRENNPAGSPAEGYCNLLDAILDLHREYGDFFRHLSEQESPALYNSFHWYVLRNVEKYALENCGEARSRYPLPMAAGFLCNGLWAFIRAGREEKRSEEEIRFQARELLCGIFSAGVLSEVP